MKKIILLFPFLLGFFTVNAALQPGDVVVVGFKSTDDDIIAIMATKTFTNESFSLTDAGWTGSAFRTGEGTLKTRTPLSMSAGQILIINLSDGGAGTNEFSMTGTFQLAASGDQIIIYQGSPENPNMIYALNYNSRNWSTAVDASTSALPTGLIDKYTAVSLINRANYTYAQKIDLSNISAFLTELGQYPNWKGSSSTNYPLTNGSFTMGAISHLSPGDIAIIGYNDKDGDELVLVALKTVLGGTLIKFGDGEGIIVYTVPPAGLAAGQIFRFQVNSLVSNVYKTGSYAFALSTNGDEVYVYQGTEENPSYIYALHTRGPWTSSLTPSISGPDGAPVVVTGSQLNGNGYYIGARTGTVPELLNYIADAGRYSFAGGYNKQLIPAIPDFIIKTGTVPNPELPDFINCPAVLSSPTASQNYIITRYFKVEGINSANINNNRTLCEESQLIEYFDGLGRKLQTVNSQNSPTGKDVIIPFLYDSFGRESIRYQPYTTSAGLAGSYRADALSGSFGYSNSGQYNFYTQSATDYKITNSPFTKINFEASPLNRVIELGAPGDDWQPASGSSGGHTVKTNYGSNIANDVKLWKIMDNSVSATYYPAGRLYRTTTMDENWTGGTSGTIEEYTDLDGRIVLKRLYSENMPLDTYFIYDHYGNLRYVIPPAVTVDSFSEISSSFLNFIYAYRYDKRRRLIERKIPGKGWEFMVYNKNDQMILRQDANQNAQNIKEWSYSKYDALGRVVMTGIYQYPNDRATLQAEVELRLILSESRNALDGSYTNLAYPSDNINVQTINYYDNYLFPQNSFGYPNGTTEVDGEQVKGLLTGTFVKVIGTQHMLQSVNFYDQKGRLIKKYAQHYLSGGINALNFDETKITYNFAGENIKTERIHHTTGGNTFITNRYNYDAAGRRIATFQRINTDDEIMLSKLEYNELSQLKRTSLHSADTNNFTQQTDLEYNERGWLSTMNNPGALSSTKIFGMKLIYGNNYSGNVGSVEWKTKVPLGSGLSESLQGFSYNYDKLNRLIKSNYSSGGQTGKFDEEIIYDVMGNIQQLTRKNGESGFLNNLSYNYTREDGNSNQLASVNDAGTEAQNSTYTYDVNGNQKTNTLKNISNIGYNYLNLPETITSGSQTLIYTYDANGRKLSKRLGSQITNYIDGIQYSGSNIDFIMTEEGRAIPGNSFKYEYFLKDHLGNTRAVVRQDGTIGQVQDYYAFGREMNPGNQYNSSPLNNYNYSGREKQTELGLNQFDYGARSYDPVIARWTAVDPMAGISSSESPYVFAGNSPVNFIDEGGQFRISAQFARMYPTLTRMLKFYLPMLKDNPAVRAAFIETTGMGGKFFDQIVSYNSGPWIVPSRYDLQNSMNFGDPAFRSGSQYRPDYAKENLYIDGEMLAKLEMTFKSASKSNNGNELGFQMFVSGLTIMHEAAHYGFVKKNGEKEALRSGAFGREIGAEFEGKAFERFSYGAKEGAMDKEAMRNYYNKNSSLPKFIGLTLVKDLGGYSFNKFFLKDAKVPETETTDGKDPHIRH